MTGMRRHRREREFGLLVGGILALIGGWWLYRGREGAFPAVLFSAGVLLVFLGAFLPSVLGVPYRGWMKLAEALSVVMTNLILAIVYFGVVTPIGLLRKALGADPLRRRSPRAASYWFPYSDRQKDPRHYEKMF